MSVKMHVEEDFKLMNCHVSWNILYITVYTHKKIINDIMQS